MGHILKGYQHLAADVKNGTRLLRELNNSIVLSATNYPENVSIQFLLNYLHQMFLIHSNKPNNNSGRDLFKDQRDKLISLLESKISRPDQYANDRQILAASRVLIRHPHSAPLTIFIENSLKRFSRRLNFEELNTALYALNTAATKQFPDGACARLEPIENEILSNLSAAKSKNMKIIAERIFLLESSSLKHSPEAKTLQNELWATFQELTAAGQRGLTRVEVVQLITKVYPRVGEKESQVITDLVSSLVQQ